MARMTDGETVLDHVLSLGNIPKGELMSGRDIAHKCDIPGTVNGDNRPLCKGIDCHCYVVG